MYGKLMRLSDDMLPVYFETLTDVPEADLTGMQLDMHLGKLNPRDAKMRLAREVIALFHGGAAAQAAEDEFVQVFQKRATPTDMPSAIIAPGATVAEFLVANNLAASKGEARRLVQQGGVSVDGTRITDASTLAVAGVWRVGPRRFVRAAGSGWRA
jgi:tyrosyl-tRNA synthetase